MLRSLIILNDNNLIIKKKQPWNNAISGLMWEEFLLHYNEFDLILIKMIKYDLLNIHSIINSIYSMK